MPDIFQRGNIYVVNPGNRSREEIERVLHGDMSPTDVDQETFDELQRNVPDNRFVFDFSEEGGRLFAGLGPDEKPEDFIVNEKEETEGEVGDPFFTSPKVKPGTEEFKRGDPESFEVEGLIDIPSDEEEETDPDTGGTQDQGTEERELSQDEIQSFVNSLKNQKEFQAETEAEEQEPPTPEELAEERVEQGSLSRSIQSFLEENQPTLGPADAEVRTVDGEQFAFTSRPSEVRQPQNPGQLVNALKSSDNPNLQKLGQSLEVGLIKSEIKEGHEEAKAAAKIRKQRQKIAREMQKRSTLTPKQRRKNIETFRDMLNEGAFRNAEQALDVAVNRLGLHPDTGKFILQQSNKGFKLEQIEKARKQKLKRQKHKLNVRQFLERKKKNASLEKMRRFRRKTEIIGMEPNERVTFIEMNLMERHERLKERQKELKEEGKEKEAKKVGKKAKEVMGKLKDVREQKREIIKQRRMTDRFGPPKERAATARDIFSKIKQISNAGDVLPPSLTKGEAPGQLDAFKEAGLFGPAQTAAAEISKVASEDGEIPLNSQEILGLVKYVRDLKKSPEEGGKGFDHEDAINHVAELAHDQSKYLDVPIEEALTSIRAYDSMELRDEIESHIKRKKDILRHSKLNLDDTVKENTDKDSAAEAKNILGKGSTNDRFFNKVTRAFNKVSEKEFSVAEMETRMKELAQTVKEGGRFSKAGQKFVDSFREVVKDIEEDKAGFIDTEADEDFDEELASWYQAFVDRTDNDSFTGVDIDDDGKIPMFIRNGLLTTRDMSRPVQMKRLRDMAVELFGANDSVFRDYFRATRITGPGGKRLNPPSTIDGRKIETGERAPSGINQNDISEETRKDVRPGELRRFFTNAEIEHPMARGSVLDTHIKAAQKIFPRGSMVKGRNVSKEQAMEMLNRADLSDKDFLAFSKHVIRDNIEQYRIVNRAHHALMEVASKHMGEPDKQFKKNVVSEVVNLLHRGKEPTKMGLTKSRGDKASTPGFDESPLQESDLRDSAASRIREIAEVVRQNKNLTPSALASRLMKMKKAHLNAARHYMDDLYRSYRDIEVATDESLNAIRAGQTEGLSDQLKSNRR